MLRQQTLKQSLTALGIDAIQKIVCDYFNVPNEKLQERNSYRQISVPRQIAIFLAKQFTNNSTKTIGEHFGGRDYRTVNWSCKTVKNLMDTDSNYKSAVIELQKKVKSYPIDPQKSFDLVSTFPHDIANQDLNAEAEAEILQSL